MRSYQDELAHIPAPNDKRPALRVKRGAEKYLRQGHPWLFEGSIREQSAEGDPGDLAVIFDRKNRFLAVGLYDPLSPIRVKVLQHNDPAQINRTWLTEKITTAAQKRAHLPAEGTTGYRLVHGEGDGLSGVIIDRYDDTAVLKIYSTAWLPHLRDVTAGLLAAHEFERVVLRLSRHVQNADQWRHGLTDGQVIHGPDLDGPVAFTENHIHFAADVVEGHKTGFFFDQRGNRAKVGELADGKRVLDVFAYAGGFAVYAAVGGARTVTCIDSSAPALAEAEKNFERNNLLPPPETVVGDAFERLERMGARKFDLVVIDPPAFAKRKGEVVGALRAYAKLAQLGVEVLAPHGRLVIASCSSRVDEHDFIETVLSAAADVGRPLKEDARTGHGVDHPVPDVFEEGRYLKCLYAVAEN